MYSISYWSTDRNHQTAKDLTHTALEKMMRQRVPFYPTDPVHEKRYVGAVIRSVIRDYIRRQNDKKRSLYETVSFESSGAVERLWARSAEDEVFAAQPSPRPLRREFIPIFEQGISDNEIARRAAAISGLPITTLRRRIQRYRGGD